MTEKPEVPELDEDEDSRRQLWIRAGVAGGLIALLLGGLAIFDHLSRPPQPEEVVPTKPIAPAQLTPEPRRQDAPPDVLRAAATEQAAESPPPVEESAPPPLTAGARDGRLERGARFTEGARAAHPSQAHTATAAAEVARKAEPHGVASTVPPPPAVASTPSATSAPANVAPPAPARATSVAAPAAPVASTVPPASVATAPVEVRGGYVVQVGSFSNVVQAEALRARLLAEGIAAQLETRVVVGPFPDRRDGLAAQARLRERGYAASDLIPFRR